MSQLAPGLKIWPRIFLSSLDFSAETAIIYAKQEERSGTQRLWLLFLFWAAASTPAPKSYWKVSLHGRICRQGTGCLSSQWDFPIRLWCRRLDIFAKILTSWSIWLGRISPNHLGSQQIGITTKAERKPVAPQPTFSGHLKTSLREISIFGSVFHEQTPCTGALSSWDKSAKVVVTSLDRSSQVHRWLYSWDHLWSPTKNNLELLK